MGFPVVTKQDILSKLEKTGVKKGDIIYVASYMPILGNSPDLLKNTISAIKEAVGSDGTIVMPVFNWDYCGGAIFDPIETPSQVGVLTEAFRKTPGVLRSLTPPWCTFAALGKEAEKVVAIRGTSPFGSDSITQYLYDVNARFVMIGCQYNDAVIHVHWLEETFEVPYRFWKRFSGKVKIDDKLVDNVSYMYARRRDIVAHINSKHLTDVFDKTDSVKCEKLGLGELRSFMIKDYVHFIKPYFVKDNLAVAIPETRKHFE